MSRYYEEGRGPAWVRIIRDSMIGLFVLVAVSMAGCPQYHVWSSGLAGQAELRRAEQNRQIAIQEAHAKFESAKLLADAEVERAKGVAEANRIIGQSLKNNEEYLRYLFVNNLEHTRDQVIYVPTEANLPILEAGRRPLVKP